MTLFPKLWRRHFLVFEGAIALVLGVLDVIYGYHYGGNHVINGLLSGSREAFYSALASIFASLFGFVIAATSIILGVSGSAHLAVVRESDGYRDLWKTLFSAIRWLGVATLTALCALVLDQDSAPTFWIAHAVLILSTLVVLLSTLVVLRLWRCVWILQETIKLVARKPRNDTIRDSADGSTNAESRSA